MHIYSIFRVPVNKMSLSIKLLVIHFVFRTGLGITAPVNMPRVELVVVIITEGIAVHVHTENKRQVQSMI